MKKITLECVGYLLSKNEVEKYLLGRIPAFTAPVLSKKAKENGAWKNGTGRGWSFTRSSRNPQNPYATDKVYSIAPSGKIMQQPSWINDNCLYVAFQVIYDPNSDVVKSCYEVERTTYMWNEETRDCKNVTSKATVITSGGKNFIWLNKKECENGTDKTMILYPTEASNKAVQFDKNGEASDWGEADALRKQCDYEILSCISEELNRLLVKVQMSSEDNYEKVTPIIQDSKFIGGASLKIDNKKDTNEICKYAVNDYKKLFPKLTIIGTDKNKKEILNDKRDITENCRINNLNDCKDMFSKLPSNKLAEEEKDVNDKNAFIENMGL